MTSTGTQGSELLQPSHTAKAAAKPPCALCRRCYLRPRRRAQAFLGEVLAALVAIHSTLTPSQSPLVASRGQQWPHILLCRASTCTRCSQHSACKWILVCLPLIRLFIAWGSWILAFIQIPDNLVMEKVSGQTGNESRCILMLGSFVIYLTVKDRSGGSG